MMTVEKFSVFKLKIKLIETANRYTATKYEEIYPHDMAERVYITDGTSKCLV